MSARSLGLEEAPAFAQVFLPTQMGMETMRLENKIAIVVGAGQGPGTGMGNGRATVIRFAQEGAKVLCVDKDRKSAEETVAMAAKETNAGECDRLLGRFAVLVDAQYLGT